MKRIALLAAVGLSLSACVLPDGFDLGAGSGSSGPVRTQLPATIATAEAIDIVAVSGQPGSGTGLVQLCLTTIPGMWRKEIRISGGATLASEGGTTDCEQINAGLTQFELVKAKAFGIMTGVGFSSLDLTGWGGGVVTLAWQRD